MYSNNIKFYPLAVWNVLTVWGSRAQILQDNEIVDFSPACTHGSLTSMVGGSVKEKLERNS